jgi:hypothetical protein
MASANPLLVVRKPVAWAKQAPAIIAALRDKQLALGWREVCHTVGTHKSVLHEDSLLQVALQIVTIDTQCRPSPAEATAQRHEFKVFSEHAHAPFHKGWASGPAERKIQSHPRFGGLFVEISCGRRRHIEPLSGSNHRASPAGW